MVEPMVDKRCTPRGNETRSAEKHLMLIQGATDEETDTQVDLKPGLRLRPELKAEDGIEHDSSDDAYPQSEEPGLYQDGTTCDMQKQLRQTGAAQTPGTWRP